MHNPIESLAAALHSACLRDLPEICYRDRDWVKHRAMMDAMGIEERKNFYEAEKSSGQIETNFIEKKRRPGPQDVHVSALFPQMWGSTALGFGGIGGAAMTTAYTTVIESPLTGHHAVYFGSGGRLAYLAPPNPAKTFHEDISRRCLASCSDAQGRYWVASTEPHPVRIISLDSIPSCGLRSVKKLIAHFGSQENVFKATEQQLADLVGHPLAKKILAAGRSK